MKSLSLAGTWSFSLDRESHGIARRWFSRELPERTELPGSLAVKGIGDPVDLDTPWTGGIFDKSFFTSPAYAAYREPDNFKVPFWLQPETYYAGVAWYQREIEIPAEWAGRRLVIELERPHWITRLWLDDRELGEQDALSTPHRYELGTGVAPGRHRLTLRVDNSRLAVNIGDNSHSISDHTQGNWNGVVAAALFAARAPACGRRAETTAEGAAHRVGAGAAGRRAASRTSASSRCWKSTASVPTSRPARRPAAWSRRSGQPAAAGPSSAPWRWRWTSRPSPTGRSPAAA